MEIDKEIEVMREKAKKARQEEEDKILAQRMKTLAISQVGVYTALFRRLFAGGCVL